MIKIWIIKQFLGQNEKDFQALLKINENNKKVSKTLAIFVYNLAFSIDPSLSLYSNQNVNFLFLKKKTY